MSLLHDLPASPLHSSQNRDPLFSIACALFSIHNFVYPHYFLSPAHSLPKTPGGGIGISNQTPPLFQFGKTRAATPTLLCVLRALCVEIPISRPRRPRPTSPTGPIACDGIPRPGHGTRVTFPSGYGGAKISCAHLN